MIDKSEHEHLDAFHPHRHYWVIQSVAVCWWQAFPKWELRPENRFDVCSVPFAALWIRLETLAMCQLSYYKANMEKKINLIVVHNCCLLYASICRPNAYFFSFHVWFTRIVFQKMLRVHTSSRTKHTIPVPDSPGNSSANAVARQNKPLKKT